MNTKEDIKIIGHNDIMGTYFLTKVPNQVGELVDGYEKYELERGGAEAAMRFSLISKQMGYVMGRILTVLEASVENERQLKALKSVVKSEFSNQLSWIYEQCGTPEEEQNYLPDPTE